MPTGPLGSYICRAPALSRCLWRPSTLCVGVSGPGALCVGAALSVSGPGALCLGPRRSLCRASRPGALCGPGALCVGARLSLFQASSATLPAQIRAPARKLRSRATHASVPPIRSIIPSSDPRATHPVRGPLSSDPRATHPAQRVPLFQERTLNLYYCLGDD